MNHQVSKIPQRPDYLLRSSEVDMICDVGPRGREIIGSTGFASQDSYNPRRGRRIANIINDMFERRHFEGKRILELGPGHYAFALLARHLGADVVCVDRDPAFVELGRHLGFLVVDQDFTRLSVDQFDCPFEGMFVKGTFNACGPRDEADLYRFVAQLTALLTPEAWGWFVTVNKTQSAPHGWNDEDYVRHRVEVQRQAFSLNQWNALMLMSEEDRPRYAIKYSNSHYLFTRNLMISGGMEAR